MARTSETKIERLTEAQGAAGPAPDRKYEFTGETKTVFGITLRQICATRSDGYTFTLALMGDNTLRVIAGCRFFDMTEARAHWRHRAGTPLGAETDSILDHFERMAAAGALGKPK